MKKIEFAEGLSLPLGLATSPVAVLGMRGRGKTRAAKKLVEGYHAAGVQVVVLDSVGVWYGLRRSADGRSAGLKIPVLGGQHGDAPLSPTAGTVVADALVRTGSSAVLDTTGFASEAETRRFMTAFTEHFFRLKANNRSPVNIVLEEADDWIPQNPEASEMAMLGAFQRIARKGRNFGVGLTIVSLRPQGLSKKVLNLADAVVCLGFNGKHERKAIREWTEDKEVDDELRENALDSLPRLGFNESTGLDGGALVWAPQHGIFSVHTVLPPATFDSSATPKPGTARKDWVPEPLDISALGEAITASVEEAKSNDPRALRAEVTRLRSELAAAAKKVTPAKVLATEVKTVEKSVVKPADLQRLERAIDRLAGYEDALKVAMETFDNRRDKLAQAQQVVVTEAGMLRTAIAATRQGLAMPQSPQDVAVDKLAKAYVAEGLKRSLKPTNGASVLARALNHLEGSGDSDLPKGERAILIACAQHDGLGGCSRAQLTGITGYKRSTRDRYLQYLSQKGYVTDTNRIRVTHTGLEALGPYEPLPAGDALLQHWLRELPAGEAAILKFVADVGGAYTTRELITEATGYKRSTRDRYLQYLSSRELVVSERDGVRAVAELFD